MANLSCLQGMFLKVCSGWLRPILVFILSIDLNQLSEVICVAEEIYTKQRNRLLCEVKDIIHISGLINDEV